MRFAREPEATKFGVECSSEKGKAFFISQVNLKLLSSDLDRLSLAYVPQASREQHGAFRA